LRSDFVSDAEHYVAEHYVSVLSQIQAGAAENADLMEVRKTVPSHLKYVAVPRQYYVSQVLKFWTDVGGTLTLSRNNLGQIQGRFSKYFFAVTRPVMGPATPSPESLPDIIARQRRAMGSSSDDASS
jgi:hypothetical protein